jgi:hypothetical protein
MEKKEKKLRNTPLTENSLAGNSAASGSFGRRRLCESGEVRGVYGCKKVRKG